MIFMIVLDQARIWKLERQKKTVDTVNSVMRLKNHNLLNWNNYLLKDEKFKQNSTCNSTGS
jgi:hypothetical protein